MKYCEREIKTAMPIMLRKASGGKEPPKELIKYAANDCPYYWLRSLKILEKVFDYIISYLSNLFLMSLNNLFAKILDDPFLMYLY